MMEDIGTDELTEEQLLVILDKAKRTGERQLVRGLCSGPCKSCGADTGDFWTLPDGDSEWECEMCSDGR